MALTLTVPKEYGVVLLTATATFFVSTWHGAGRITKFRKAAKIPYPSAYATAYDIDKADSAERKHVMYLFNCAQRAHTNFIENYITALPAMLIAGLTLPLSTAAVGAAWTAFRLVYAVGYTRSDKEGGKGRLAGSGFWFAQVALYVMAGWTSVKMLL